MTEMQSQASYPYVPSYHDAGPARGPRLAVCFHMAEGGGTVGFLSRQNAHGVSVHFVIEYSGRIVRMLPLEHMHTSIRANAIRTSDDKTAPYYGRTAAKAVMGKWADTQNSLGPNHASIGVEVEGFAKDGPNAKQSVAIDNLAADMESRFPEMKGHLGHRDFADYKQCPGKKFPWGLIGGHGVSEDSVDAFIAATPGSVADCDTGTKLYRDAALTVVGGTLGAPRTLPYLGNAKPGVVFLVHNGTAWCVDVNDAKNRRVESSTDCTDEIAAATTDLTQQLADANALNANYTDRLVKINGLSAV